MAGELGAELGRSAGAHPRSRTEITPFRSASSISRTRFWFCGRSPIPNFSKRTRRWPLTASRERKTSSAICWLVAGVGVLAAFAKRSAERDQDAPLRLGQLGQLRAIRRGDGRRSRGRLRCSKQHDRRPKPQLVVVGEPPSAADPLTVHIRAVARETVVGNGPVATDALDLRMKTRYLLVESSPKSTSGPRPTV